MRSLPILILLAASSLGPVILHAQDKPAPKPGPDTLLLNDGETLIGHFVSAHGATVRQVLLRGMPYPRRAGPGTGHVIEA